MADSDYAPLRELLAQSSAGITALHRAVDELRGNLALAGAAPLAMTMPADFLDLVLPEATQFVNLPERYPSSSVGMEIRRIGNALDVDFISANCRVRRVFVAGPPLDPRFGPS